MSVVKYLADNGFISVDLDGPNLLEHLSNFRLPHYVTEALQNILRDDRAEWKRFQSFMDIILKRDALIAQFACVMAWRIEAEALQQNNPRAPDEVLGRRRVRVRGPRAS